MRQEKNSVRNNKGRRIHCNPWAWIILGVIVLTGFVGMPGSSMADPVERPIAISFSIPEGLNPEEQEEIQTMKNVLEAMLSVELENLEGVKTFVMDEGHPSARIDAFVEYRDEKKSHFSIFGRFLGPLENSWSMIWKIEEMYQSDDAQIKFRKLKGGSKSLDKKAGFEQIEAEVKEITKQIGNRIGEMTRPKVIFTSCFMLIGANIVGTLQGLHKSLPADLTMYLEAALKEQGYKLLGLSPWEVSSICVQSPDRSTLLNYLSKADYIIDGQISEDFNPDNIVIDLWIKDKARDKLLLKIERKFPLESPDIKKLAHDVKEEWVKIIKANQ